MMLRRSCVIPLLCTVTALVVAGSALAQCPCGNGVCDGTMANCAGWGCVCDGAGGCMCGNCPNCEGVGCMCDQGGGGGDCDCAPCHCQPMGQCGKQNCPGGGGPPPDCTCGLPDCFGMGCACGAAVCECAGDEIQCMNCNYDCPPPDPCTAAVACSSQDGCGNEQDCFCDHSYCENDGPMCCMGGEKIRCATDGCQGEYCETPADPPPACGGMCMPCACDPPATDECRCGVVPHCDDYCGEPPCGGRRKCKIHGCRLGGCTCTTCECGPGCLQGCGPACSCPDYYCLAYEIPADVKPFPCKCWDCSFATCSCEAQGACGSPNGCPLPTETCATTCTFGACVCETPGEKCEAPGCVCDCASYDACPCFGIGDCGDTECCVSDGGFGSVNS